MPRRLRPADLERARHFARNPPETFAPEHDRENELDQQAKYAEPPETDADPLDD